MQVEIETQKHNIDQTQPTEGQYLSKQPNSIAEVRAHQVLDELEAKGTEVLDHPSERNGV